MWIYLALLAALFLGFYNLSKKHAVSHNAVFPVLWLTNLFSLLLWSPIYISSRLDWEWTSQLQLYIPPLCFEDHLLLSIKSMLVGLSWILGFFALKHLPITLVAPVRASGPIFTLIFALSVYGERPEWVQLGGFALILFSMWRYSALGRREGISFRAHRGIWAIILATLLGSASGLYDKFLIQYRGYEAQTVQWWFAFYMVLFVGLFTWFYWWPRQRKGYASSFNWKWSIPLVSVFLLSADFVYFRALQDSEAMIVLVSALKRGQILITVMLGGLIFKEKNKRKKLIPLAGVLGGILAILLGR